MYTRMPNLNEIEKFKDELKNIAHEDQITAGWGERVYDELPLPDPAEVPDIDLDALLPESKDEQPNKNSLETFADTDTVHDASVPNADTTVAFAANTDAADTFAANIGTTAEAPITETGNTPELSVGDAYPVDDEGSLESSKLDDFLSSLNFDNLSTDDADAFLNTDPQETSVEPAGTTHQEAPAGEDSVAPTFNLDDMDFGDMDFNGIDSDIFKEPEISDEQDTTAANDPAATNAAEPLDAVELDVPAAPSEDADDAFDFDDMLSSFDFNSNGQSSDSSITAEDPFLAELKGAEEDNGQLADTQEAVSHMPADGNTFDGAPLSNDLDALGDLNNLDEISLFSEDRDGLADALQDMPNIGLSEAEHDAASLKPDADAPQDISDAQPLDIKPVIDADLAALAAADEIPDALISQQESESSDHTGFSLEENPLESDITEIVDDQFNLPDNFKDFSANTHARMFDSVIAKSTGSTEDPDRLTISDDDYFAFLNKLESFPLNVQLAVQNYIANGDDSPENKMDFIRFVLGNDSLKKIVNKLEKILNTSIPIPRGFQRRSVEEYEREKHTFKYWFVHRLLPVAVMSTIALILVFCIGVLSWQFIYKPITAESLYKAGYTYLENGQYEPAIEKFDHAGEYKRKKKWYFAYARAFRAKKQFTAAERMYSRLLYDFKNDKQGGLEYAEMLSTDLRNYEKAETVLRRRVLDYHVNDKDGMLALGDVFMNWADEDPEKYTDAVKIYSRLIELYGENDTFLLRMMQYFIRTDNLAEVLKLKYHFGSRITKIDAPHLTELSGYLLEKRYNPKPLDSEKLRAQIDDVRMLLEKAVQADKNMPEACYNLGRFFIYNNKQDGAIENLERAIALFKNISSMTARRLIRYVDAMRLLGEQFAAQKKYMDAQALYADAISMYRDYTAFKPLPPHGNIGKLYADYGDIDYFISYNFDSALKNYQHAVKELYDTPSIHYRIGCIHYNQENYEQAIASMSRASSKKARDQNLLYGFGNAFFKRGDYFAALAAYEELFSLLNAQRARKERALSNTRPDDAAFIERYMHTANNLGAALSRLSARTGDSQKNGRALALYAEATRAWDALTRNPQTMIRAKSVGLAYLNTKNMLNASSTYESEIYTDIPMILDDEKALEQKEDK